MRIGQIYSPLLQLQIVVIFFFELIAANKPITYSET